MAQPLEDLLLPDVLDLLSPGWRGPDVRRVRGVDLDVTLIPAPLREKAVLAYERGDALDFLSLADNVVGVELLHPNIQAFKERGCFETALTQAMTGTRTNNHHCHPQLSTLIRSANRQRLRAAGDPLPVRVPFRLYRGVAARGRARRVRGYSWTVDCDQALWFATRYDHLEDPAVFATNASADDVLFFDNEGHEQEFALLLSPDAKVRRMK